MGTASSSHTDLTQRNYGKQVEFTINGKSYKVGDELAGDTSLNTFIREHAHLKGTKYMCLEGGCGTCVVTVEFNHPATYKKLIYAANSCLVPVFACHGWKITTTEGLGSKRNGYHTIQKRLAAAGGTQCGYCSPGMVMNMNSLLESNPDITMTEIENSFGGNICRCTGYRSILDAMKSLAKDAPNNLKQRLVDIEDSMVCPKNVKICKEVCNKQCDDIEEIAAIKPIAVSLQDGSQWYRPTSKSEIFEIFDMIEGKSYRFVSGNTGQGVYRINPIPQIWIDLTGISELQDWNLGHDQVTLGANISLTETMAIFNKLAKEHSQSYAYCKVLADHIDLIANVPVRNMGSLAGNIYMKHQFKEFPSDVFLILETVGASVVVEENSGIEQVCVMQEFLEMDLTNKIISKFIIPALPTESFIVKTYKIMPRAQNAHAYVNAGFKFKVSKKDKYAILEKPSIVFGGINPNFIHASQTEEYLNGKALLNPEVLDHALKTLHAELKPDHILPDASPEYRIGLAESLFYKFVLSVNPESVHPLYRSGGSILERPLSSGKQDYDTNKKDWPVNEPIPKIEGLIQCSGEAEYSNDTPSFPGELWAQLVLCDRAGTYIDSIDPKAALEHPGVVAFLSAKDIPVNTFVPPNNMMLTVKEKVFADGRTDYAGQAVGMIVAETAAIALQATKLVKIKYGKVEDIITDPMVVITKNISSRITQYGKIEPTAKKDNVKYKIKGEWSYPSQYHNFMESQTCVAVPSEDHLDVYPAAQWPGAVHEAISNALGLSQNQINVKIRRVGGGYGGKITVAIHTAVACALAAHKLNRPVRLVLNIETCMEHGGKRFPVMSFYEAGVDENGVIQNLDMKIYEDDGYSSNDAAMRGTLSHITSCYDQSVWNITGNGVMTDNPSNTWCRAPGSAEGTSVIENVMEHIAKVTKKDPLEVRLANMTTDNPCIQMIKDLKESSDYDNRVAAVNKFNEGNRWKKRGISLMPLQYPFGYFGNFYGQVSVFKNDGTVAISHSAVEMGQGANTKVVQVAAYILGVDVENISVKPIDSNVFPNAFVTGGSFGSESAAYAIKKACEILMDKLKPAKEKLGPNAKWKDVILEADAQGIELTEKYMFSQIQEKLEAYQIYGVAVTEVEVDILTGQHQILRMDVIEDAGQSLSPEIDIGQVEGSIAMGIGLLTTEELIYDKNSGRLLTTRTWNYKPPGAKDIPVDLRITLRKNAPNPLGVLRSKATGEPPFCLSNTVPFAIRHALESARKDAGKDDTDWVDIKLPFTRERTWLGGLTNIQQFKI